MKKFFVFIMSLFVFVGCKGVNIDNDPTQAALTPAVSKENKIMMSMTRYSNDVIKDFTQDYELPLDSIKYSYDEENNKHRFNLEHDSENGVKSRYTNDQLDESHTKRTNATGEPIPNEILKNMDRIFDRALEDFNKKYEAEENIHFKHWSLYEEKGKYIFNGILESDKEHPWDIYYNVEKDIEI